MRNFSRLSSRSFHAILAASAVLLPGIVAMGDAIYVVSGRNKSVFPIKSVTVTEIRKEGGVESLFYMTESGSTRSKPLESVIQIEIEGETLFNQAEAEFAKGDLAHAGEDYRKAIKKAGVKDWIKQRCDERLLGISSQTGDFLGAVTGFVELARKDPVAAAKHKPTIDKATKKELLGQAITAVLAGMSSTTAGTKLTLYPFLAELYNANGQGDKAAEAVAASNKLLANASPGAQPAEDNTNALALKAAEAESWLTKAKAAFASQQYDQALTLINGHAASFVDPDHQAGALFLIAQAKEAQAAKVNTQDAWEDTALAYMRVVAHFKSLPGAPAADALYKTGMIEEKLKKMTEALAIYNQVINEFKDSNAAKDAKAAITRINAARG